MTIEWETGVADPKRIAALERSGLVGSGPEDAFDRLIELAVELTGAPRGCITLVDTRRTTAKSGVGFPEGLKLFAPVEQSFCRFVVGSSRPLVVEDARTDPRTIGDAAIEAFGAIAWAGFPIEDSDGAVLGTICLMDEHPREWRASDLHLLATLARSVSSEIALRASIALATARREEIESLRSTAAREYALCATHIASLDALGGHAADLGKSLSAALRACGGAPAA